MSFVQWGEDVPPPLSPATGIDGPWLARLGLAAPAPPRRFPLPPSLAGVLGRPCSGRWHGHRRTGDLKGVRTMTHQTRESWLNAVAQGVAPLFEALDAPLPDRVRVAIGFTSRGAKGKAIGECWDKRLSADGNFEIFIRPDLAHAPDAMPAQIAAIQIGRASCRDRVCRYELMSVVAASLKKKKNKSHSAHRLDEE